MVLLSNIELLFILRVFWLFQMHYGVKMIPTGFINFESNQKHICFDGTEHFTHKFKVLMK